MLEEIKTKEELKNKKDFLLKNPFHPNKFIYAEEGESPKEIVIINGRGYDVDKSNLSEDFYHPGYFFLAGTGAMLAFVTATKARRVFDPENPETWCQIVSEYKPSKERYKNVETSDYETYNASLKKIISQAYGELKPVSNTEEELLNLSFVKGTVNPDFWFPLQEKQHLDKMLPYKKFENIYHKVDINDLEHQMRSQGYPEEEIKKRITEALQKNILYGVDSLTYTAFEGIRFTFGVEIETCIGRLDDDQIKFLNVKAVHDGSLRDKNGNTPGGEYVTGVLTGDAGLTQLSDLCRALSSKCRVNAQCGVHVHAGSLNWNREDIVYSYILAEMLEDELFMMLPKSRRSNTYCRRLTELTLDKVPLLKTAVRSEYNILIDTIYNDILKEVTQVKNKGKIYSGVEEGVEEPIIASGIYNREKQHPNGAKCGYDKSAQRYCWLNYVTLMYNTKGGKNSNTLEIRSHSATMNFKKIKNWIKIFFAFCKYVETSKSKIRKGNVTLAHVIKKAYPKTGDKLLKYIEERKQVFNSHDESVDYVEISEERKTIKEIVAAE